MPRIVDLTVTIGPETFSPPSVNKQLTMTSYHRGPGFWQASSVDMVLHTGSHVDFSLHVMERGETAADVPLERFCGEALVLDLSHLGPSEPITAAAVAECAGDVRPGDIVLVHTGWTEKMTRWQSIHIPNATAEDLGLVVDQKDLMPFVMASGTLWSHVMINTPPE